MQWGITNTLQLVQIAALDYVSRHGIGILIALVIFILGIFGAKYLKKLVYKSLALSKIEQTLNLFLVNFIYLLSLLILITIFLAALGIPTASLITLLGVIGFALSLGLRNSLANVASGLLIIFLRPFKVGDNIEFSGASGKIQQIDIFMTKLIAENGNEIIIPNGKLTGDKVIIISPSNGLEKSD